MKMTVILNPRNIYDAQSVSELPRFLSIFITHVIIHNHYFSFAMTIRVISVKGIEESFTNELIKCKSRNCQCFMEISSI